MFLLFAYLHEVTGVQGVEESEHDRNFTTSQSSPVAAETAAKRKADAEITDLQIPVKKIKTGKSLVTTSQVRV